MTEAWRQLQQFRRASNESNTLRLAKCCPKLHAFEPCHNFRIKICICKGLKILNILIRSKDLTLSITLGFIFQT